MRILAALLTLALLAGACGSTGTQDVLAGSATAIPADQERPPIRGSGALTATMSDVADDPGTPVARTTADDVELIVLPGPDGRLPADRLVGCRSGEAFPSSSLDSIRPLSEEPEIEAQVRWFLETGEGQAGWLQDGWQIVHQTDDFAIVAAFATRGRMTDSAFLNRMRVAREDGEWEWSGSSAGGDCALLTQPPGDLGVAEWELDPNDLPGPDDTTITVLVSGLYCASGQSVLPRLVGPDLVMTDRFVMLAFAERRPSGAAQTCQGIAPASVRVELPEPLQGRPLVDGLSVLGNFGDYLPDASDVG